MIRILLLVAALLSCGCVHADEALWALLEKGGQIGLISHGLTTPGVGDPPGFTLVDCKTQRNLIDAGRREAQRLGAALRAHRVPIAKVLSSPWCRCIETARLVFGTEPAIDEMLSNLFEHPQNRDRQLAALRNLVASPPTRGNLMLVTHGSTTAAFTGINQATAEMVIVTPEGGGKYRVAGRLAGSE